MKKQLFIILISTISGAFLAASAQTIATQSAVTFSLTLTSEMDLTYPDGSEGDGKDGDPDDYKLTVKKRDSDGDPIVYTEQYGTKVISEKYTTKSFITDLIHLGVINDTTTAGWSIVYINEDGTGGFFAIKKIGGTKTTKAINIDSIFEFSNLYALTSQSSITEYNDDINDIYYKTSAEKGKAILAMQLKLDALIVTLNGVFTVSEKTAPVTFNKQKYIVTMSSGAKLLSISGYTNSNTKLTVEGNIAFGKDVLVDTDTYLLD